MNELYQYQNLLIFLPLIIPNLKGLLTQPNDLDSDELFFNAHMTCFKYWMKEGKGIPKHQKVFNSIILQTFLVEFKGMKL